jgi:hypothetical protein
MAEQNQQASDAKIKQEFNKLSIVFKDQLRTSKESKETLQEQSASLEGLQKEFSGFTDNIKAVKTTMIKNLEVSKLGNKKLLESSKKLIKNIEKIKNPSSGKGDKTSMFFEKQEEENRAKVSYQENHITLLEDILKALSFKKKKQKEEEDDWWDDLFDFGIIGAIGLALAGVGSFLVGVLSVFKDWVKKKLPKKFREIKGSFGKIGETFSRWGDNIKDFFKRIKNSKIVEFFRGKGGILSKFASFFSGFGAFEKVMKLGFKFGKLMGRLAWPITVAISVWDGLMGGFEALNDPDLANASFGEKAWAFIKGAAKGIWKGLSEAILDIGGWLVGSVVGWFDEDLGESIKNVDWGEKLDKVWAGMSDQLGGVMDTVGAIFSKDGTIADEAAGVEKTVSGFLTAVNYGFVDEKEVKKTAKNISDKYTEMRKAWDKFSFAKEWETRVTKPFKKKLDEWKKRWKAFSFKKEWEKKVTEPFNKKLDEWKKRWDRFSLKDTLYNAIILPFKKKFENFKEWWSKLDIIEIGKQSLGIGGRTMKEIAASQKNSHGGGLLRGGTTKVLAGEGIERLKTGELYVHNESKTKGIMDKSEQMAARKLQPQAPTVMASNPTNNMVNNSNSNNITTNNTSIAKFGPDAALMDVFAGAAANA